MIRAKIIVIGGLVILGILIFGGDVLDSDEGVLSDIFSILDSEVEVLSDGKWNGLINYNSHDGARSCHISGNGDKTVKIDGDLTMVQIQRGFSGTYIHVIVKSKGRVIFDETDSNYLTWSR